MQDLIKTVSCSNVLQIYTILNVPALNYKIHSTYLIRISQHFRLLSCPALASEGCRFIGSYVQGIKSYISCPRYITILY